MANSTIYPYGTGGELPSGISIINDDTTGGANMALSAEVGKRHGARLDSIEHTIDLLAPLAFRELPITTNPNYINACFYASSVGKANLRVGNTNHLMTSLYDLGDVGGNYELRFSCPTTGSYYPGLLFFDENYNMSTYAGQSSATRTVTGSVTTSKKYIRFVVPFADIYNSYVYDEVAKKYAFDGSQFSYANVGNYTDFIQSDYFIASWRPNTYGDWLGWNFTNTDTAATGQRTDYNYQRYRRVGTDADADYSYSISKTIDLPTTSSSIDIEFSCGEVDSGLMLRRLNPTTKTANYNAANENPRTVTIDTTQFTQVQLYFKTANYANCYIKDATNNVMLWEGHSS